MKKLIFLLDATLKNVKQKKFYFFLFIIIFSLQEIKAAEKWIVDKNLSTIEFELKVLFAKNVKGEFLDIDGFVEIDLEKKNHNKAIFFVNLKQIDMNYIKYKYLLLSNIFFDVQKFPLALVDTKKFSYENEKELSLDVELTIKGKSEVVPLTIIVKRLAEELVHIKSELTFSRTNFNIGTGGWSNTAILKDKAKIITNLFLFKE